MPVRWDLERITNWERKFGEILLESEITKVSVLERHCTQMNTVENHWGVLSKYCYDLTFNLHLTKQLLQQAIMVIKTSGQPGAAGTYG